MGTTTEETDDNAYLPGSQNQQDDGQHGSQTDRNKHQYTQPKRLPSLGSDPFLLLCVGSHIL